MINKDNVSKAREIANEFANENVRPALRIAAEEMAEWKDRQYAEIIKEECNTSYQSGLAEGERMAEERSKEYLKKKKERELDKKNRYSTSISEENYYGYRAALIAEIINEHFGEG